jgi:hypothetical protein
MESTAKRFAERSELTLEKTFLSDSLIKVMFVCSLPKARHETLPATIENASDMNLIATPDCTVVVLLLPHFKTESAICFTSGPHLEKIDVFFDFSTPLGQLSARI